MWKMYYQDRKQVTTLEKKSHIEGVPEKKGGEKEGMES